MEKSWSERVRTVKGKDTKYLSFALAELGESRGKKHPSFSKDDLETQMPSGRGSTSTALKKRQILLLRKFHVLCLDSRVLDRVPTSRHRGEHVHRDQRLRRPYPIRATWQASISNRVLCLTAFPKKFPKSW